LKTAYTFKSGEELFWGVLVAGCIVLAYTLQSQDPSLLTDPRTLILAMVAGAARPALAAVYNAIVMLFKAP
jgi:hypothetical protein